MIFGLDGDDFWAGLLSIVIIAYVIWIGDTFLIVIWSCIACILGIIVVAGIGRLVRMALGDVDV